MAFVASDWSIAANGDIRYGGDTHGGASPSYATVIEFHRALQDFADDQAASGDDLLDISSLTPSDRSTDNIITLLNGFNIDDASAQHLYDGSIIQNGGNDIYDGIVNFGNTTYINVLQNGALIVDDFWNSYSPAGFNADANQGISHRFMVKVRAGGADTDGRRLIGLSREFGKTYSEFSINGTARGNNVLALSQADDLNNQTAIGTVAAYGFSKTEGYRLIDVQADGSPEDFYIEWNIGGNAINQLYEYSKWFTRRGTAQTIMGLAGDVFRGVTNELAVTQSSGTFVEPEAVSWTGGTGQILAVDSTTAATKVWIQTLTGSAPSSGNITGAGGAIAVVTGNTPRTIPNVIAGASTGTALLGAYGFGVRAVDLKATDSLTDLSNVVVSPPNNVTFTVSGLITGEDRVLVTRDSGTSSIDKDQLSLNTTLSGAAEGSVVVTTTIPSDTPASGTIRVVNDAGFDVYLPYTGFTGSTFTLDGTFVFNGTNETASATAGNNVYISYIDELADAIAVTAGNFVNGVEYVITSVGTTDFTLIGATSNTVGVVFTATGAGTGTGEAKPYNTTATFTVVYSVDRNLFIRVRDGGSSPIKTFETTGTLTNAGGSTTAIRTSDA